MMRCKRHTSPWSYGLFVFVLILAACGPVVPEVQPGASEEAQLVPVKVGVGFIPNVQFAVFYVGIEEGFYADQGLDVQLEYGFENDYLRLVGTNANQFMVGSGDQVIIGRAQGLPVRYVMNWYSRYPVVLFSPSDSAISEPSQMAGKTIGIPGPFGASYVALRGLLEAGGLQESDVKLESIGFTQAAAVSEGLVDAAIDYGVNGPIVLANDGIATDQIALDDYLQMPANGLVTNDETIATHPDLVQKMVHGTERALRYTLDNPDKAFEIALKHVPEAGGDNRTINRAVFDAVLEYWDARPGMELGETRLSDWEQAVEFMQRINLVDSEVPAAQLFTNEFLP